MNEKLKMLMLVGIFFLALVGFYFLYMRSIGYTDTSQIEKASVSQGAHKLKKIKSARMQICMKFI